MIHGWAAHVDLDNTMFDTDRFKADLFVVVGQTLDRDATQISRWYDEIKAASHGVVDMEHIVAEWCVRSSAPDATGIIIELLHRWVDDLEPVKYLLPGVAEMVSEIHTSRIHVFTQGNAMFHEKKLETLPFDNHTVIDEKSGEEYAKDVAAWGKQHASEHIIVLNDKVSELRSMLDALSQMPEYDELSGRLVIGIMMHGNYQDEPQTRALMDRYAETPIIVRAFDTPAGALEFMAEHQFSEGTRPISAEVPMCPPIHEHA